MPEVISRSPKMRRELPSPRRFQQDRKAPPVRLGHKVCKDFKVPPGRRATREIRAFKVFKVSLAPPVLKAIKETLARRGLKARPDRLMSSATLATLAH